MHQIRRALQAIFVLTLAALLVGGILFVVGQAAALAAGQGAWLAFFDDAVKPPMCIAASLCAVAGFLLGYKSRQDQGVKQEAGTR
ncbi:hypothetical protein [Arthrobacter cupressi]|uniref:Uncharacterized protein n=1 Tax=Arthrobacter cupressi TaxID=1045773 RepID=A0A1G8SHH7_9MICC|nr:hypothetical protein [Arthrobacter cupressi]NYD78501.1 membrane protein implicated in regulation of membrane protease activity [Arthrobacter cupressi]SDJ28702.1 hypothetical protein SAMN05216555_10923 [Arthrobacter cupressi]